LETAVFWWCCLVECGKTRESLKPGSGPQGIFTVRPELLVPFAGESAA